MFRVLVLVTLCGLGCSRSSDEGARGSADPQGSGATAAAEEARAPEADEASDAGSTEDTSPSEAATVATTSKVLQVVIVGRVACARRADGRVRCWGRPDAGTRAPAHAAPVEIPELADAVAIDHARGGSVYVVTGDGRLLAGTLDLAKPAPLAEVAGVRDAVDVRIAAKDALVLTRTGNVVLVSKGTTIANDVIALATSRDGPIQLLARGGGVRQWHAGTLTRVLGLDDGVDLFGDRCALRRGGQVACWTREGRTTSWDGPANIIDRVYGTRFRCDLTASGVACAGANDVGQLGAGPGPDRTAGRTIDLPGKPIAVAADERSACAVLGAGEVACWGANEVGQLGDGTLVDRTTPVIVAGLTTPEPPPPSDGRSEVEQSSVAMDWSGMPGGCTRPTTFVAPGGEPTASVRSAYAHARKGGVHVWLADFQLEPGGYRPPSPDATRGERPARGSQIAFELVLARGPDKRKSQPIDRGRYRDEGARRAKMWSHVGEVADRHEALDLVVEKVDKTWICGQLLDPADPKRRQPFAARFHEPSY